MTYSEIAEKHGVSRQAVQQGVKDSKETHLRTKYNLHRKDRGVAYVARETGIPYETLRRFLSGETDRLRISELKSLLKYNGQTFEEVFGDE